MTSTTRRLIVAALALAPAACSGLLGGGGPPTALYNLTAVSLPAGPRLNREILIDKPNATDALDTRRIALRRNQLSFNYFAEASWTDPAPAMIHALLIESMQRSGRVKAVSRNTTAILGDYELRVDVRRFEADYAGDVEVPTVRIEFGLILVHVEDRAV
ncbi:MAG: ABC-type transport auxiliary lipoprotein family protein, partial [Stellaceae bacterium]